jgi:hypothetical protein
MKKPVETAGVCLCFVGGWRLAGVECGEHHSRRSIKWHEMELLGLSFISLGLAFILETESMPDNC